ncbi:MAG: TonB family protein [Gemmatimonadaceae bacterium]
MRAVRTDGSILATALICAMAVAATAAAQSPVGVIKGVVRDSLGTPVNFAEVVIVGTRDIRTFSDSQGRFRLSGVPFGEVDLRARRLGFRPSLATVQFSRGTEPEVELRIYASPDYLPNVEIREQREAFDGRLAGFKARSEKGAGHFITRERLERVHSYRFTDVLREVPGIRFRPIAGGGGTTVNLRGALCPPLVFVDGNPATAGTVDLEMFDLASVEGIEIYSGMATVPPEFVTGRGLERCGVIAIWSRPYRPKPRAEVATSKRSTELDSLVSSMTIYTMDEVDTPAGLVAGTASPEYPDSLRLAGVPGRVVVEMVVGTNGLLENESLFLVSSTNPLFTGAVQEALATARFRVATLKSRKVRQLIQLPFVFKVDESADRK